ncbi:MAG TPA: hypothetical protein VKR53_08560 [Puia sp.]|nr:hypothetical protein [Puia sp.]
MEVHHHPKAEKKNLKEYFLEFLMIFLAVTMGFFAENLREHIGDKGKEREYLSSMVNELAYDTSQYNRALKKIYYLRPILDSLFINLHEAGRFNYVLLGKWNTPINETRLSYLPTMPTIQQLTGSGNLRLIDNKAVLNKILEYQAFIQGHMKGETESIKAATEKIYDFEDDLCNESVFNVQTDNNMQDKAAQFDMENGAVYDMRIVVKDSVTLNRFANSFVNYKSRNWGYYTIINEAKKIAADLIGEINKQYGLN